MISIISINSCISIIININVDMCVYIYIYIPKFSNTLVGPNGALAKWGCILYHNLIYYIMIALSYIYIYIYIYIHTHTHTHAHIYIYIYTHTYTYIHIHIYNKRVQRLQERQLKGVCGQSFSRELCMPS